MLAFSVTPLMKSSPLTMTSSWGIQVVFELPMSLASVPQTNLAAQDGGRTSLAPPPILPPDWD